MESETDQEDHQSVDVGEGGRERVRPVREVIRELRDTGRNGAASSGPSVSPKGHLVGQVETERVRVVRGRIQACERRDTSLEDHVVEAGSQIERVYERLGIDNDPAQASKKRKTRIVCGRQALVALLKRNEEEKERELRDLLESCPVRNFAFRNRIQSALIIGLMKNSGSAENNRQNTTAASELGFLRQRQTVSGLREGFLSGLQNNAHVQENDHSGILQNNDRNISRENETQDISPAVVVDIEHDELVPANRYSRSGPSSICTEYVSVSRVNLQGSEGQIEPSPAHVNGDGEETVNDEVTLTTDTEDNEIEIWEVISSESRGSSDREHIEAEETSQPHSDVGNVELQLHGSFSNPELFESAEINVPEDSSARHLPAISQDSSRHDNIEHIHLGETREAIHDHHNHGNEDQGLHSTLLYSVELEVPGSADAHTWDSSTQGDEAQEWIDESSFSELRDRTQPESDQEEWPDGATINDELSQENTRESERRDQSQLVESFWHESGSPQTLEHWSPLTLETGALSSARADLYDYSDDDNAHNIELQELLSRRRVSSLLSSGFRESLDQLVQSYVERQSHTPNDLELHETSPPPFVAPDPDHVNTNHNDDSSDAEGHPSILRPISVVPSNRTWEQHFHDIPWSRNIHQRPESVIEMINDLRIEIVRLQQRLNHTQGMLEACMDGQLELQRTIRQEVSAALNRSANPSDEAGASGSSFNFDLVREGTCCICRVGNIDSLLYRCGHMCTCTKCAGGLVERKGKCPMCEAPVVEAIRAYTLQ